MSGAAGSKAVLVTGAAGFIGSHVVDRFLADGHAVVGVDCFDEFYDPSIKRANLRHAGEQSAFELVEGDIRDRELVRGLFESGRIGSMIHLAARAGVRPSLEQPELYADVNVRGTTILFEEAQRAGVHHVVYASSSSVYGGNEKVPFAEEDPVDHPVSPYAATKKANELLAHVFHHVYGMTMIGLRFFTVYGPRQRPEMAIHKFTRLIDEGKSIPMFGDGSSSRDYTYVDDIVDGVAAAWERGSGYRVYNLGGSQTTRLSELIEWIAAALGQPATIERLPMQPGDVPRTFADLERSGAELGYSPRVDVKEGLRRFVAWYRDRHG